MAKGDMKIFVVDGERLIQAHTVKQVKEFLLDGPSIEVADAQTVAALMSKGVEVEKASAE